MAIGSHTTPNRGATDVWLTPLEIVRALGPFDLDPCGAAIGESRFWPTARAIYLERGLERLWAGRVWLNPPYSDVGSWLERLADHGSGTALTFARTETRWFFKHIWRRATAVLFLEGRLHFHHADGRRAKANAGGPSVLVAYGQEDRDRLLTYSQASLAGAFFDL